MSSMFLAAEHVAMKPEEFFDAWELSDDKLATSAKKDKDSKGPHDA